MNKELLTNLCAVYGPSGLESKTAEFILNEIKDYIDDYEIDNLGNLIAHKKGPGKKIMLAAHMDQIGGMVTFIDKEGFLRFTKVGGLSPTVLLGQRVVFENGTEGVIHTEKVDNINDLNLNTLFVDIGAENEEEAKKKVSIGDTWIFAPRTHIDDKKVCSAYLDDRIGCYILIEILKQITDLKYDAYFVFTSQEEVGCRGAKVSAYSVNPDYALAYDVTVCGGTPKANKLPMKMYGGACIKLKDASLICHQTMVKHLAKCAETNGIKHQYEILEAGGTDVGSIHVNQSGVVSGAISIAVRHVHTPGETCAISDIDDCINLSLKALQTEIQ